MNAMFSDPEMQEIFEGFLVETRELLDNLSTDLMTLEKNPDNLDLMNQIFRSIHTIKGTSSFMGFENIAEITHHAEDVLNKLRRSELTVTNEIIDAMLDVHDWVEQMLENIQSGDDTKVDYSETIALIDKIRDGEDVPAAEEQTPPDETDEIAQEDLDAPKNEIETETQPESGALDRIVTDKSIVEKPGDFTDDEYKLIEDAFAEVNKSFHQDFIGKPSAEPEKTEQAPPEEKTDEKKPIEETLDEKTAEAKAEPPKEAPKAPAKTAPEKSKARPGKAQVGKSPAASETIRIDVSRVETLMDLSGELVLGRNRLAQITENLTNDSRQKELLRDLSDASASIDFITSEIQAAVMRMRMVPIGKLYQKAPRIVRDLSKEFGKKINLIVKGEDTEIDRGIIEELNDPLVHMIRNSCDHGIESAEEREKEGKPKIGTITLDADQEGNNIVLRISDDGKGMDPEKLKAKALEKGVINQEQAAQMGPREAYQLIFHPGFSTAKKVSSVSGRGVGMDVVRTNIQKLKGIIDIESETGKGSTFIIKLPLTLAIIHGLLVKVFEETYAIPLSSVIEVVAIEMKAVSTINGQEVIRIRHEEVLPLVRLDKILNHKKVSASLEGKNVVSVGHGVYRVGFVVDELLGQQEIVIKSLGEYLGSIKGVAGSTILGDGRVIMIIDVAELIDGVYSSGFYQGG